MVGALVLIAPALVVRTGTAGPTVSVVTDKIAEAAETLPATSVAFTVSLCTPSGNVLVVIEYFPSTPAVAVPTLFVPSNSSTLDPASATPLITGVAVLVIPSENETPVSEAASSVGSTGASGAFVSTVTLSVSDRSETLPAASLACTVNTCSPSLSVPLVMVKAPPAEPAATVAVPNTVVPSSRVTVEPASAVPVILGVFKLMILSVAEMPVSDAASRAKTGLVGARLSTTKTSALDATETLAPLSTVLAVKLWDPSDNFVRGVATQFPLASAVVVPTKVCPSNRPIVLPAIAVPVIEVEGLLVRVNLDVITGALVESMVLNTLSSKDRFATPLTLSVPSGVPSRLSTTV